MKAWVVIACLAFGAGTTTAVADTAGRIEPEQLEARIEKKDADLVILDVRTPNEFAAGHVPGALNIPHDQLPNRLAELAGAKNKEIVVYCRSGKRAASALETLEAQGFSRLTHLEGDMLKWEAEKRATEK